MQKKRIPIYLFGSACIALVITLIVLTGIIATGSFQIRKIKLVITTGSESKEYDGKPLKCDEWTLIEGEPMAEHTLRVIVRGEQTHYGKSDNHAEISVIDKSGLDVTKQYDIELRAGVLEVTRRKLVIASGSKTKVYDGEPLKYDYARVKEGRLRLGDRLEAADFVTVTDPGHYENLFSPVILDESNNVVTDNYEIVCEYGDLIVTSGYLILKSDSGEKEYDGKEIAVNRCWIAEGSLHEGDRIEMEATGKITGVGKRINTIEAKIYNAKDEDVTELYEITYDPGVLVVTPRRLVIQTKDVSRGVDEPAELQDWSIVSGSLVEGEEITVKTIQQVETRTIVMDNTVVSVYIHQQGKTIDVSNCYQITYYYGKAEIHW